MPKYILAYHNSPTELPEGEQAQQDLMAAWGAWFENMGAAVVQPGNPVGMSKTVSAEGVADNGGANPVSGLTIVEAADQDAACEMAEGCPMVVDGNGSVEVAEVIQM